MGITYLPCIFTALSMQLCMQYLVGQNNQYCVILENIYKKEWIFAFYPIKNCYLLAYYFYKRQHAERAPFCHHVPTQVFTSSQWCRLKAGLVCRHRVSLCACITNQCLGEWRWESIPRSLPPTGTRLKPSKSPVQSPSPEKVDSNGSTSKLLSWIRALY